MELGCRGSFHPLDTVTTVLPVLFNVLPVLFNVLLLFDIVPDVTWELTNDIVPDQTLSNFFPIL